MLGLATAQTTPQVRVNLQDLTMTDIATEIESASQSIIIYSPQLRQPAVAEALRKAMVDRNLTVYILTDAKGLKDASSFTLSLALIGWWDPQKPSEPRRGLMYFPKVNTKSEAFVILDSERMLVGNLISRPVSLAENNKTRLEVTPSKVRAAYNWAAQVTRAAEPFNPYKYLGTVMKKGKP